MPEAPPYDTPPARALERNIRLFMGFRVLFNARFYYPVFAILFLDFGLTMEEFALVNVVWAVAIVTLEVPSGALADRIGRRNMVVLAASLMVVEMLLLAIIPLGSHAVVLAAILVNRILSGAAEASASGADEALAYDSLCQLGRRAEWPSLLDKLMRLQSGAFFVSSIAGALVYDPAMVNRLLGFAGVNAALEQSATMRIPIVLTLLTGIGALAFSLRMTEPPDKARQGRKASVADTVAQIASAGKWILATPAALVLICAGFLFDSAVRLFLTLNSSYYRLIDIPESAYGILGSAFALLGIATAPVGRWLVHRLPMTRNLFIPAVLILFGLIGLAFAIPYWGALFVIPMGMAFFLITFFLSHYLNDLVDSTRRATVLSFKGLFLNLAYGTAGIGFSALVAWTKSTRDFPGATDPETAAFGETLPWLPAFFAVSALALLVFGRWRLRNKH